MALEFAPKLQSAKVPYTVDFLSVLPNGVTIASASVAATVFSGNDPDPSAIVSGAVSISGTQVTQVIAAGVSGTIYQLVYTAVGSDSNDYELAGFLAVLPGLT